ncbi:MAG: EVE domain-containing protein, partial [Aestuariivirga sp.]
MAYWLFKSEPDAWSWDMQKAKGKTGVEWSGVRNYQARNHMKAMKLGDKGFFYHTGDVKAAVGIVEVAKLAHKDSTAEEDAWECVDIRALVDMPKPVGLDTIKA